MDNVTRLLMQGAAGAAGDKTYVDDVFSTYLYKGNQTAGHTITNGIDLAGEGGMVWIKSRTSQSVNEVVDSARGVGHLLVTNYTSAQGGATSAEVDQFNSDGFRLAYRSAGGNANNVEYTSWTFRKAPGFFDVVTYTGNDTNRTIAHSLGCVPGMILIKGLDAGHHWQVYHRDVGNTKVLKLNDTDAASTSGTAWNNTSPTATHFSLGTEGGLNTNNQEFVAYLFAGGDSTAATARSVDFDGSGDWFTTSTSSDYAFGTGDFTIECWFNLIGSPSGQPHIADNRTDGSYTNQFVLYIDTDYKYKMYKNGNVLETSEIARNTWNHIALVRSSGVTRLYLNGTSQGTYNDTNNYSTTSLVFGANAVNFGHNLDGRISNLRIVKGTAVYTSAFTPSTEPLTNITNTKLLCFNNSSTTGTTVGTITASGDPTASTDSPFDDPAGYTFGEGGDQNIIKCGSYKGSGSAGLEVNVGWEPSWLMIKATSRTGDWYIMDSMRGVVTGSPTGNDEYLRANVSDAEGSADVIEFTSTGFKVISTGTHWNNSAETYSFTAIRRSDGLVGKPAEVGTDVFAMDGNYNGSGVFPQYTSGFPVDFSLTRDPDVTGTWQSWHTGARLLQGTYQLTATSNPWAAGANFQYDYNDGIFLGTWTDYMSWMWKRHAGFDVVCFKGVQNGKLFKHNLGRVPEMMWFKCRTADQDWMCYHKGLNGGVNPEQWSIVLASNYNQSGNGAQSNSTVAWNNTAPTAEAFSSGGFNSTGHHTGEWYVTMLFASVEGISKVGYYAGNGSTSGPTITTGFSPRFLIIKWIDGYDKWFVFDTVRGVGSGNDCKLFLNNTGAQQCHQDWISLTSTGFSLISSDSGVNGSGNYIYYAHA